MEKSLPPIPAKRYFTIGEVSELCGVKPYVLRYWEQEFSQLKPMKRRGNRRYYQHHEVLLIRRIRDLLYDQGFTISGARNRLSELGHAARGAPSDKGAAELAPPEADFDAQDGSAQASGISTEALPSKDREYSLQQLRQTDPEMIRVLEDLINVLMSNGVLRITDLPPAAQHKLINRSQAREGLGGLNRLISDDEGGLI